MYNVAIIGAGSGGRAFASYLASKDHLVNLGYRTFRNIRNVLLTSKIQADGEIKGSFKLNKVSRNYKALIKNVDIILIVVPANAHKAVMNEIIPYLEDNQIILLNPGRTWGAIECYHQIKRIRPDLSIHVGETQTLLFTCRKKEDYGVSIIKIKNKVNCCFYPEYNNYFVSHIINEIFPQLEFVDDIRITSLNNIGAIVHPTTVLFNAGSICRKQPFLFYRTGNKGAISNIAEQVDKERCEILNALGVKALSFLDWVKDVYGIDAHSFDEAFKKIPSYETIGAPSSLRMRYLTEDVPTGLVPLSSLGSELKIPTPTIDSLIKLTDVLLQTNYEITGRTIKNVNLPMELFTTEEIYPSETHEIYEF
ncbi:MAG: NADP transhydrogenase subunit alpha [Candidatus Lokiarchaeota archaeon]|nr:NADP transhydrogenase subunit alpha [Candidatus Lokiarchaeota archaeon]